MSFQEMLLNGLTNLQSDGDFSGTLQQIMSGQYPDPSTGWYPNVDIVDTPNNLYIYMELPGVTESSISVDFFNNRLNVSGEKIKRYTTVASKHEIIYGKFVRRIVLPLSVTNPGNVIVNYDNGILSLTIDKKKELQNRFVIGVNHNS